MVSRSILNVATTSSSLLDKLEQVGLADIAASYLHVFEANIDMEATIELHVDASSIR